MTGRTRKARDMSTSRQPEVLFLCVHNAGRSQMAAALLRRIAGDRITAHSAGSTPGETLNPAVVAALAELDLDISGEQPKGLTDEMARDADVIVTMGCGASCTVYPGKRYLDWELTDPAGKSIDEVRVIRDEIDSRVRQLADRLLAETRTARDGTVHPPRRDDTPATAPPGPTVEQSERLLSGSDNQKTATE